MEQHNCPICKIALTPEPRYPKYVCSSCASMATDKDGRLLEFFNSDLSGGFEARYVDTQETYTSHRCFIDSIECYADEARFGGIVIQTV
jgi:hypothetical protein